MIVSAREHPSESVTMIANSNDLKNLYLEFFKHKRHKIVPNASLIPENDPSVLFTTAGMHPLVPFLLGQTHPLGKRLANVQKCLRTSDIDQVGDNSHLTFFEMLGNWSLGDYWKKEAIEWSFEFLSQKEWLGLDKERIFVTVFSGDDDAPRDEESAKVWQRLGIPEERIFYLPKKDNWWGPVGETGPCGPDTEMFYDTGREKCSEDCKPGCSCEKYFEIWNNVFMQYNKTSEGTYETLKQKNVDTGMGVERTIASLESLRNVYETDTVLPVVDEIKRMSGICKPDEKQEKSVRIIADHIRASTFILAEKIVPSNVDQGYVLRRFIRRTIRHGKLLNINEEFLSDLAIKVITVYSKDYPELENCKEFILSEFKKEEMKFNNTLVKGLNKFGQIVKSEKTINGKSAFLLFQSFGFPIEMTKELTMEADISIDEEGFKEEFRRHQAVSGIGAERRFKGGLIDASEQTTRLHTATHLLNEALRQVLSKKDIIQKGSNITSERLRFDFNFERKLSDKEIEEIEDMVNAQILKGLPVKREEASLEEARKRGAQAVFEQKYSERVCVYSMGNFSFEVCAGPHVQNTSELGKFRIVKEEGVAAGVRRIRAVLE